MERIAQCQCGQLRAVASGEPDAVNMCHCSECQRRTGAVFGSGAYYKTSAVRIEGPSKLYTRDGQEDRKVRIRFCPNCGSSVYCEADLRPGLYGIAVGAFADPRFRRPRPRSGSNRCTPGSRLRPKRSIIHRDGRARLPASRHRDRRACTKAPPASIARRPALSSG